MKRRGLVISSAVGLALAIAEAALFPSTITIDPGVTPLGILVGLLGALAAGVAGRLILGTTRVHNYYKLGLPVLAAVSGFAFASALSSWLISRDVVIGLAPSGVPASVTIALIIGVVVYLGAAFLYGFAGVSQGVGVRVRSQLLVLLLLAVVPFANVVGLIGFLLVSALRKPAIATDDVPEGVTPELPAASE